MKPAGHFASPYLAFVDSATRYADQPFLTIPASARPAGSDALTLSYRETLARIENQKQRYQQAGYRKGLRVALLLGNGPEFFVHFFSLNALGVSIVPLNGDSKPHEIAYAVQHSEARLAVGMAAAMPLLKLALGSSVTLAGADEIRLPSIEPAGATDMSQASQAEPSRDDECAILYTSGTTGTPKGCILDNRYFLSIGELYLSEGGVCEVRPGLERLITPLPLFHMNALACSTMAMVLSGGCVIQLDRFHPRSWWQDVASSGATIVHYLGVMPAILLAQEQKSATPAETFDSGGHGDPVKAPAVPINQVRFGYGANVDPRHQRVFEERFGFPLVEGWAMTETGGAIVICSSHEPRHVGTRCFGQPRAGMEVKLVNEDGADVPDGTPGHMLVRRAGEAPRLGFFRGYLKDEAATEAAWQGGWFHTGDSVRRGPDGSLHFVDRLKNIIRRSGENIAALEVEACLLEHDAVRQTAVIAAPDALRDEEVMACVILAPGQATNQQTALALQAWCLERMAYYKAPGYVAFVDVLPTTSTNKVHKIKLAALGADPLNAPLCFDLRASKKRTA
jgi:acyl-CoA synthetase (AMP-forming)/AMP-acid ligase II